MIETLFFKHSQQTKMLSRNATYSSRNANANQSSHRMFNIKSAISLLSNAFLPSFSSTVSLLSPSAGDSHILPLNHHEAATGQPRMTA
jgi:hypothetical protein